MITTITWLALSLPGQAEIPDNPVFQTLIEHGVQASGKAVPLPKPSLPDGQDAAASRAVLKQVVGDDRSLENFLRDSVTAPFVLKTRDIKAIDATIRVADLWFAVRGSLNDIDLKQVLGKADVATVDVGNMRLSSQVLTDQDLADRKLDRLPPTPGRDEWYTHTSGRLLDRIGVEVTDRAVATLTADSLIIAAATSRACDDDPKLASRWETITRTKDGETKGRPLLYAGGGSYAKITRLAAEPGMLLVEAHFAFVEPDPWFSGNPILRSKMSLICQDQVRQLRREIQKRRGSK